MVERDKKKFVRAVDIVVSLFIIVVGFLVIIFGILWGVYIDSIYTLIQPDWLFITPWIITFIGITTIIYGFKRIAQDIVL